MLTTRSRKCFSENSKLNILISRAEKNSFTIIYVQKKDPKLSRFQSAAARLCYWAAFAYRLNFKSIFSGLAPSRQLGSFYDRVYGLPYKHSYAGCAPSQRPPGYTRPTLSQFKSLSIRRSTYLTNKKVHQPPNSTCERVGQVAASHIGSFRWLGLPMSS